VARLEEQRAAALAAEKPTLDREIRRLRGALERRRADPEPTKGD
jgi:hypothetical protein